MMLTTIFLATYISIATKAMEPRPEVVQALARKEKQLKQSNKAGEFTELGPEHFANHLERDQRARRFDSSFENKLERESAEKALKEDDRAGQWLLRYSSNNFHPNNKNGEREFYALSYKSTKKEIKHNLFWYNKEKRYWRIQGNEEIEYPNLKAVMEVLLSKANLDLADLNPSYCVQYDDSTEE